MNAYYFEWKAFATDALLTQLAAGAGLTLSSAGEQQLESRVAALLGALGRLNVAPRTYTKAERTTIAIRMLSEAIGHVLAPRRKRTTPGYLVEEVASDQAPVVTSFVRIPINTASASELQTLPSVGAGMASRIIQARQLRPIQSLADLDERVEGVGPALIKRIGPMVTFALPNALAPLEMTGDFDQDWRTLLEQLPISDPLDRVNGALEMLLMQIRAEPRPDSVELPSTPMDASDDVAHQLDEVEVLFSASYHPRLIELLSAAVSNVEVAMFHIALTTAKHPSSKLLVALEKAQQRGVSVRVLVDADRAEDPYLSTVINQPAIAFLKAAGVAIRQDAADKLLHSKCLVIDDELVVIGSHNWTAGSYFKFDDLSLAIQSSSMAVAQRQRFDALWADAVDA